MKSDRLLKHSLAAFAVALACYVAVYSAIEHRRTRKGPWEVVFTNNAAGTPTLIVNQPSLGISNVAVSFEGADTQLSTNVAAATDSPSTPPIPANFFGSARIHRYSRPFPVPFAVPFGECLFMDTTFLPGTITFKLFGHEVELLPRVLIVDYQEHPWRSDTTLSVPRLPEPAKKTAPSQ
jgi:hypothetical protein